jgi:hypothetical protein
MALPTMPVTISPMSDLSLLDNAMGLYYHIFNTSP